MTSTALGKFTGVLFNPEIDLLSIDAMLAGSLSLYCRHRAGNDLDALRYDCLKREYKNDAYIDLLR